MKFCSSCGSTITRKIPQGDDRERHVCDDCNTIHYQNPRIIAGALITHDDKVLLCKRAIEPRKGYWTLPAGFMENGETTEECAARETWEEAKAEVGLNSLYVMYSIPFINQVYLLFRGDLVGNSFDVGPESAEVDLFTEEEIPWDDIAFPVMTATLKHFFEDRKRDHFPLHSGAFQTPSIHKK